MSDIRAMLASGKTRDKTWIMQALQVAIDIELFTIPPYLTAMWSICNEADFVAKAIRGIVIDEMAHVALTCNLLAAIGGKPVLNAHPSIPKYPGPIPGNINPELLVSLSGLSPASIKTFMAIEAPQSPIIFQEKRDFTEGRRDFPQIGAFYEGIMKAFIDEAPTISVDQQLSSSIAPLVVTNLDEVCQAIERIRVQGEGSEMSPTNLPSVDESTDELAHFYRFQEIDKLQRLEWDSNRKIYYWGAPLSFPSVFPVATVPPNGYTDCTHIEVKNLLNEFDKNYSRMLNHLHRAWNGAGQPYIGLAIENMFELQFPANRLMQLEIGNSGSTYSPHFIYLPDS